MPKNAALSTHAFKDSHPETTLEPIQLDPFKAPQRSDEPSFKWMFAQSICNANHMATSKEQSTCKSGVPCTKLHDCLAQAEHTLRYLDARKAPFPKRKPLLDQD